MEFGLHEEFPIYAGGLGILAGDFIKSAHDLGAAGDRRRAALGARLLAPAHRRRRPAGPEFPTYRADFLEDTGVRVRVRVAAREVEARVWRTERCGNAPLYLLEPVAPERRLDHAPPLRARRSTAASRRRSCSASAACARSRKLGIDVDAYHFNEGHAVFAGLELIAERMAARRRRSRDAWAGGARADRVHHPHAGRRRQRGAPARRAAPARRLLRAGRRRDARRSAAIRST